MPNNAELKRQILLEQAKLAKSTLERDQNVDGVMRPVDDMGRGFFGEVAHQYDEFQEELSHVNILESWGNKAEAVGDLVVAMNEAKMGNPMPLKHIADKSIEYAKGVIGGIKTLLTDEQARDAVWDEVTTGLTENPGAFAASFFNAMAENPEYLMTPLGAKTAAAKSVSTITNALTKAGVTSKTVHQMARAAAIPGGAVGGGITGAVTEVPIAAVEKFYGDEDISYEQIAQRLYTSASFSALLGGMLGVGRAFTAKIPDPKVREQVEARAAEKMDTEAKNPIRAAAEAADEAGVPVDDATRFAADFADTAGAAAVANEVGKVIDLDSRRAGSPDITTPRDPTGAQAEVRKFPDRSADTAEFRRQEQIKENTRNKEKFEKEFAKFEEFKRQETYRQELERAVKDEAHLRRITKNDPESSVGRIAQEKLARASKFQKGSPQWIKAVRSVDDSAKREFETRKRDSEIKRSDERIEKQFTERQKADVILANERLLKHQADLAEINRQLKDPNLDDAKRQILARQKSVLQEQINASTKPGGRFVDKTTGERVTAKPGSKVIDGEHHRKVEYPDGTTKWVPSKNLLPSWALNQWGAANNAAMFGLGVTVAGGLYGYAQDHSFGSTLAGALLGLGAVTGAALIGNVSLNVVKVGKSFFKDTTDYHGKMGKILDQWEGGMQASIRSTWQFQQAIKEAVPDQKRREAITLWLEGDKSVKLSTDEIAVAHKIKKYFKDTGELGVKNKVLDKIIDNYVTHLWRTKDRDAVLQIVTNTSTTTRFARDRVIPTYRVGIKAGLTPRTLDIAEIAKTYGDSVHRAILNRRLIDALMTVTDTSTGKFLITKKGKGMPKDYVNLFKVIDSHPQLKGLYAHPSIVPSLRHLFSRASRSSAWNSMLALNFASKRMLVSTSFFHAMALFESMVFAANNPVSATRAVPSTLAMLRHGEAGDVVDTALRAGLKIGTIEDMGGDVFYQGLKDIQETMRAAEDKLFSDGGAVSGATIEAFTKFSKWVDHFMWDKVATGSKLTVFMKEYERMLLKYSNSNVEAKTKYRMLDAEARGAWKAVGKLSDEMMSLRKKGVASNSDRMTAIGQEMFRARRLAKDIEAQKKQLLDEMRKNSTKDPDEIAADVADYVNDAFGGLNWRRIAEGILKRFGTKGFGARWVQGAFSPSGRQKMQLILFAPDWTIANIRVLFKALPGIAKNSDIGWMHRRYFFRAALWYATVGQAISQMTAGINFWEGEEPFKIPLGHGRYMQLSKQFMEPFEWVHEPGQTLTHKMATLPSFVYEVLTNKQWLSSHGAPPIYDENDSVAVMSAKIAGHFGGKFLPISVQQVFEQGPIVGISGFIGKPIYTKTKRSRGPRGSRRSDRRGNSARDYR